MDTLINKHIAHTGYLSRYNTVPIYYDTLEDRKVYGIGQSLDKDVPYVTHKVTEKDTLWNLSLKYNVQVEVLAEENNMEIDDILRIGSEIKVPIIEL